ncbi:MAG: hypothetical protein JNM40_11900 [Myxococcales bacterium]|nr:hypothetical protein [Myxococcales bacterium]
MGSSVGKLCALLSTLGLFHTGCVTSKAPPNPAAQSIQSVEPTIDLLVSTRLFNTTEPCGCTSTPLGDVSRIAALLKQKPERSLLLDAGGLRYEPKSIPPSQRPQARLKADFIEKTWHELSAIASLQPEDLRGEQGITELQGFRRLVANVSGLPDGLAVAKEVRTIQGIAFGIIGLADPNGAWPAGITVNDPAEALSTQLQALQNAGVVDVIVLAGLPRDKVRRLSRKFPAVKLWVSGADDSVHEGVELPEQSDGALIVTPGYKGERIYRISLHPKQSGGLHWQLVSTPKQRQRQVAVLGERAREAEKLLTTLTSDPSADPTFVKTRQEELASLRSQIAELSKEPVRGDGYVTAELVSISRSLPRDPQVRHKLDELDRQIGTANLSVLSGPPPDALPGSPRYVGNASCLGACHYHEAAHKLWQTTQHSRAYRTLVEVGKELSYDCVGCHTTAFDAPAGSNLFTIHKWEQATNPPTGIGPDLRHVGCEVCHGPGSLHVAAPGKVKIPTPRPDASTCQQCHTPEHSDTFEWKAYARGILGEGHGAATKEALGSGPTGKELRQAARQKAAAH